MQPNDLPNGYRLRTAAIEGPGASLSRMEGPAGTVSIGLRMRPDLVGHTLLREGMDRVSGFLKAPGVPGLLPLVEWDREQALFVYEVDEGRLLAEVLTHGANRDIGLGERVAVELLARVAAVLDRAERAGVPSHGSLTPWRVVVYPDGDVALLGYGLPPVEVIAWLDQATEVSPGAALRYAPPERIQGDAEDVRADMYALAMICAEIAIGVGELGPQHRSTDAGLLSSGGTMDPPHVVVERILSGEPIEALEVISEPVRLLIEQSLSRSPDHRPASADHLARAAFTVLESLSGRTLGGLLVGMVDPPLPPDPPPPEPPPKRLGLLPEVILEGGDDEIEDADTAHYEPFDEALDEVFDEAVLSDEADEAVEEEAYEAADTEVAAVDVRESPRTHRIQGIAVDTVIDLNRIDLGERGDLDLSSIGGGGEPGEPVPQARRELRKQIHRAVEGWIDPEALGELADADPATDETDHGDHTDESGGESGGESSGAWPLDGYVPEVLHLRGGVVDLVEQHYVPEGGDPVKLSDTQAAVLGYLAGRPEEELSREELWEKALGGASGSPESVRGLVSRLRKKIEIDGSTPDHLHNVKGVGYRFSFDDMPQPRGPAPLPEPEGPLYGRDAAMAKIRAALRSARLVTVTGPPGSGVSQVALHAAHWLADGGKEVHRCAVGDGEALSATLARGMGVRRVGRKESEVLSEIGRALAKRDDLAVFLDAPHPHPALRSIVSEWLAVDGQAPVLVACRGPLGVEGEVCVRLDALDEGEAVELLRQRIAQVRPGTELDDALASTLAQHLDRMPEAIEALAAQAAFAAPDALLDKIKHGQSWGEGKLEADVSAAIERLDEAERKALEQAVVFRDGFDLASAEAVIGVPAGRAMIGVIEALVARSMLRVAGGEGSSNLRWTALETVRAQVQRSLDAEVLDATRGRHALHYGELGLLWGGRPWVEHTELAALLRERENLRAVLQTGGAAAAGAAIGLSAILGYEDAGPLAEAIERLLVDPAIVEARKPSDKAPPWRAIARLASARLALVLGHPQRARQAVRQAVPELTEPMLLVEASRLHAELGSASEAEAVLNNVVTADPWLAAVMAQLRGRILAGKADNKRAERAFVEAMHGFATLRATLGTAHTQRHFAEVLATVGNGRRAVTLLTEAMASFEEVTDRLDALQCRMRLAEILVGIGDADAAAPHLEAVMEGARAIAAQGLLARARGVLGAVRAMARENDEAEELFFLALAGSAPEHKRIQALFALFLALKGDAETAHEEAQGAVPDPLAVGILAALERGTAPLEEEPFLLYDALEAWRAGAPMTRIVEALGGRASIAVRMVLACPKARPQRAPEAQAKGA